MKKPVRIEFTLILMLIAITSCNRTPVPKPRGYFRIDFPAKEYSKFTGQQGLTEMPCSFEYPLYGKLTTSNERLSEPGWFNIEFPSFHAKLYLTYKAINNDFADLMEQTYRLNIKNHISKADAINEQAIDNYEKKVYGMLYDLKGNTATAVQFYATDSVRHYLRGSLYFSAEPNPDSLSPVIGFFRDDIIHLIQTLEWK